MKKIINDFTFKNKSTDITQLNFLNKISKTPVCVSKKTGLVFYNDFKSSKEVLNEWSNKVYSNKMQLKNNYYTDNVPGMSARHFLVLEYLNKLIKLKDKRVLDLAFGEGGLLLKARRYFEIKDLLGVEHSSDNILKMKARFKKKKMKIPEVYNSSIEKLYLKKKSDVGILCWTLAACSQPLDIIDSISRNIKKNGYLIVAESSRVLVPFKKPIFNYFNSSKKTGHLHPWHWSFNSLSNIFKLKGFDLVSSNNYINENDLILVFKNAKNFNQNYTFDKASEVVSFFKRWKIESKNY